ncbi:MAG: sulfite exporter TauE/SafE family protein, partial [Betaproteobacteria bacterium]|nr:sulfite exporter TauE/SafE family protein [Betaproteobacteria bacterium]
MHLLAFPDLTIMLAVGAALGFFGGLFGIGGGIIAIPMLVLAFGMDQSVAQGTALVMMVPNLLIGWWLYSQHHPVSRRTAAQIGILACLTTWTLARVATGLAPEVLRTLFGVFLLLLSLRLLAQLHGRKSPASGSRLQPRLMPLVGIVGGSSMGLLGIGGGLVATPLFTGWFGQRQTVAQSLSLALVAPSSMIALMAYGSAHRVDWSVGLPLAIGGLFTVSGGVALAHRLPERRMRNAFAWLILCTAV